MSSTSEALCQKGIQEAILVQNSQNGSTVPEFLHMDLLAYATCGLISVLSESLKWHYNGIFFLFLTFFFFNPLESSELYKSR